MAYNSIKHKDQDIAKVMRAGVTIWERFFICSWTANDTTTYVMREDNAKYGTLYTPKATPRDGYTLFIAYKENDAFKVFFEVASQFIEMTSVNIGGVCVPSLFVDTKLKMHYKIEDQIKAQEIFIYLFEVPIQGSSSDTTQKRIADFVIAAEKKRVGE